MTTEGTPFLLEHLSSFSCIHTSTCVPRRVPTGLPPIDTAPLATAGPCRGTCCQGVFPPTSANESLGILCCCMSMETDVGTPDIYTSISWTGIKSCLKETAQARLEQCPTHSDSRHVILQLFQCAQFLDKIRTPHLFNMRMTMTNIRLWRLSWRMLKKKNTHTHTMVPNKKSSSCWWLQWPWYECKEDYTSYGHVVKKRSTIALKAIMGKSDADTDGHYANWWQRRFSDSDGGRTSRATGRWMIIRTTELNLPTS